VRIEPFRMERMQSRYENYVEFNLSESGVDPMSPGELLDGPLPACLRVPNILSTSGDGSPAGTFESWFFVKEG